jgi:hypothetical protein
MRFLFQKGKKLSIKISFKLDRTYLSKPVVLDTEKNGVWAELAFLDQFKQKGYDGVWLDTFHKRIWKNSEKLIKFNDLPERIKDILNSVNGGRGGGRWDLVIWKGSKIKFVELKHLLRDKIRENQIKFMNALLKKGFKKEDFIIAEWDYKK